MPKKFFSSHFISLAPSPPSSVLSPWMQAAEWVDDIVQQEEGEVQKRWLLLEEEERREDHTGGSHEVESAGS